MASLLGNLLIKISADTSAMLGGLAQAQASLKKTAESMQRMGMAMTRSVTLPILAVGGAAVKMAMDAVESENLFKESMAGMADSARVWSEDLRKQLGLNSYEVRKNVATFNVMLGSMGLTEKASYDMSKGLTQLAYDMASLYNLKPEEAFLKLQSGISGEIEPLKRLGILVNENTIQTWAYVNGLVAQGAKLTEQEKVLARYGVIMEQTSKAQGDLARTMDSPTNKLRIMGENIKNLAIDFGMALMPAFEKALSIGQKLIGWVENAVKWFIALDNNTKKTIITVVGLAAAIGPVMLIVGKLAKAFSVAIGIMTASINPIIIVIGGLIAALIHLYGTNEEVAKGIDAAWKFLYLNIPKYLSKLIATFGFYVDILAGENVGRAASKYTKTIEDAAKATAERSKDFKTFAQIVDQLKESFEIDIPIGTDFSKSIEDAQKKVESLMNEFDMSGTPQVKNFKDMVKSLTAEIKQQTEAFMNFIGMFDIFARQAVSGERLINRMKAQVKAMSEWQQAMTTLEERGINKNLLEQIRSMGPQAVDQAMALARMTNAQLAEYGQLYEQRTGIASEQAGIATMRASQIDTNIENQINITITESNIKSEEDAREMANKIVRELRLAGVSI